ncbi:aldehyde dehydrogenase [Photobacterium ganghwense]|uniref:aldehyde dehydrogenase n=1 Tax=Photobacterium ganghwense TaxID=320778 RepID=UPI001A8E6D53|nr:aldehyde dehydrogenase [Photobacterium ganghwense]QSV16211.1 aldehyde dehydrogenase [Photobacterium ganghwense]
MPLTNKSVSTVPLTKEQVFAAAECGELFAGCLVSGLSGERATIATLSPYDGKTIGKIEAGNEQVVNAAATAARTSFESGEWSALPLGERKAILQRWVALMTEHSEELAALDCVDAGKPISECLNTDIPETIHTFAWYTEAIDKVFGRIAPTDSDTLGLIVKEPIGVVGAVLPWNFPAQMFAWKVAPALAAGNAVIVKPAEQTSLSAYRMVQLAHEAGVPKGTLSLVTGLGEAVGQPLGLHPDVDVVSFTGSTEVGRLFLQYSAQSNLKEIVLECGGKSPQIIFPDVYSLDEIVGDVLNAAFWNMSENCSCGSRLLVHTSIKDALVEKLKAGLDNWKLGDPQDPQVSIGPMIEPAHFEKVRGYLARTKAEGATLVHGGGTPDIGAGLFVEPTIFDNVTPEMALFQEEVFGPILAVTTFDSEEEAVRLANDGQYGLAASLYTADIRRAHRVSRQLKAGTVSVNCFSEGSIATPFGGYKQSGFGGRDNGLEAFDQYLQTKTIWLQN